MPDPVSLASRPRRTFGSVLTAALVAGLLAGLIVGLFHLFATEPVIQRAIDLEEMLAGAAQEPAGPEVVSRPAQRLGLILGFLIYGLAWGLLFGLAYWFVSRLAGRRWLLQAIGLALAGYWALGVFPQLKYPASPPGVGDPATIGYRQGLYFGFLALSCLSLLLTAVVYRDLGRLGGRWREPSVRLPLAAGLYLIAALALALWLPGNPDPSGMPPELVATFRWLSLAGVTVFWLVLGGTFALLARRWTPRSMATAAASRRT